MKLRIPSHKLIVKTLAIAFLSFNGIGYVGAYLATHYKDSHQLSLGIPRPQNYNSPRDFNLKYTTHRIPLGENEWLDSWLIESPAVKSQGAVILFHGKDNNKSSLLDAAKIFHSLNYDTLLVDFRGSGKSSGNKTTIGVEEAKDVVSAVNYLDTLNSQLNLQQPVILYGISMGSAAILRAIAKHDLQPDGIILELPFTSLLTAVRTRFKNNSLVAFPMAELIVFWGGIQHGFNGFAHQPIEDAKAVKCPTLIFAGERDRTISLAEVEKLSQNLDVPKNLVVFPQAGHEILARNHRQLWLATTKDFLTNIK